MANISCTYGEITIKTSTSECLDILLKMFENCEGGDYSTYLLAKDVGRTSPTTFNSSFDGTGRWDYNNNIESFVRWNDDILSEEEKIVLKRDYWLINYQYTDSEPGCDFLAIVDTDCIHYKDQELDNLEFRTNSCENPDLTWGNLISCGVYESLDDYINSEKWYVEEDVENCAESFIDDVEDNKKSLLSYYNCSFEQLKKEFSAFADVYDQCVNYLKIIEAKASRIRRKNETNK